MIFHFGLFPGETSYEIFQKIQKNTIFDPLCPFPGKTDFSSKSGSWQFFF